VATHLPTPAAAGLRPGGRRRRSPNRHDPEGGWPGQVRLAWPATALSARRVLAVGVVLLAASMALIAPVRLGVTAGLTRALLFLVQPFEPSIAGFAALPATTTVRAADGTVLARLDGPEDSQPVRLGALPPDVPRAVLAAEDAEFYREAAVNPISIVRAASADVTGGGLEGGSTITQQLAKINYLGSRRSLGRKLEEVLYAGELARRYSKDQLLERYLNQVYFGDGAYGISAAARTFFAESPQQLTVDQAATLAGKIRAPEALDPFTRPAAVTARRNQVLTAMAAHGWLPRSELGAALAAPLAARHPPAAAPTVAPEFVDYVRAEAATLPALGPDPAARDRAFATGGYTVDTTLDPAGYRAAVAAARSSLGGPSDPDVAVASVAPGDGAVRILFGGLGYRSGGFDPAIEGAMQAGSAFKPFVYLAALQDGIDPRSVLPAYSPMAVTYRGSRYTVHNYEPGAAAASIDDALAQSINTVFVQLAAKVGPDNVARAAEAAGLPPSVEADAGNPSIALGALTHGVSPLQMATAYATIAARGVWAAPYSITRIVDRHGRVVYQHAPDARPVLDPAEVAVLTGAMEGVVQHGTGVAAGIGRPLAGKTGTTDNYTNAWFIGFVPQLSTAVWVGYTQGARPMTDVHGVAVTGGTFPAAIFSSVMGPALAGLPALPLTTASPDTLALMPYASVPSADGSYDPSRYWSTWSTWSSLPPATSPGAGGVPGPASTTSTAVSPGPAATPADQTGTSTTTSSTTTSTSSPNASGSGGASGGSSGSTTSTTTGSSSGGSPSGGSSSGGSSSGGSSSGSTTSTTAPSS